MKWSSAADDATPEAAGAYLGGASRDGYVSRLHRTLRISQANVEWLRLLQVLFEKVGSRSWIYRESAQRSVWTLETCCVVDPSPALATRAEVAAFVRGYFDAEGGIPRGRNARFYIQLCQKDYADLSHLRAVMVDRLDIPCGRVHNPSAAADPSYWRFYVRAAGHERFAEAVGSWHPVKAEVLRSRFGARYCGRTTLSLP